MGKIKLISLGICGIYLCR